MAVNYSINKVRVCKLLGSDAFVGIMDPVVGMKTQYGIITALDSGNFQVTIGVGQGAPTGIGPVSQKFYPHQLNVQYSFATGVGYGFPTQNGSVTFGHKATFPTGVTKDPASGMTILPGNEIPQVFSRL